MPRLPDLAGPAGGKSQRQRVWEAIRDHTARVQPHAGSFTVDDLSRWSKVEMPGVREYVRGLAAAGYLGRAEDHEIPRSARVKKAYFLARDHGIDAPRVRRDGSPITAGLASQRMWAALTALDAFHIQMLAEIAEVRPCTAFNYCAALARAGYLLVVRTGQGRGVDRLCTLWSCAREHRLKPRAPMVTRLKAVYDPNTRAIVWHDGHSAAADQVELGEVVE